MPQMQNRVQETTTTGGTGTLTLSGAVTGYITFASGFSTGTSLFYTIDNGVGEWEIGIGTLVTTGTLSRVTVIASSNGGALVNFGSGTKRVFCSAPTRSLVPDQDSKSGYVLTTDGTNPAWTQTLNGITIGNLTAADGAFTTLSASSTVSGSGFSTYLASPPAIGGTYPAAGKFTTLEATGNTTLGDAAGDTLTINAGTTTCAGNLLVNLTAARTNFSGVTPILQIEGTTANTSRLSLVRNGAGGGASALILGKTRGTSVGENTILQNGDLIGSIDLQGADGSDLRAAARITGVVDGSTISSTSMPGALLFLTSASGSTSPTERLRIDSSGNIKQQAASTDTSFYYNGVSLQIQNTSVTNNNFVALRLLSAAGNDYAAIWGICSAHTAGAPAGSLVFGTNSGGGAATERLRITSAGNYEFKQNSNAANTSVSFNTTIQNALTLDSSGNLRITNSSGGLGYGTGAGGSVTQGATNGKGTTVTLNNPTGQITMNAAALGPGAAVGFTLYNSSIGGIDSLIVQSNYGANAGAYVAQVSYINTGIAVIRVTNITGGSLSEACTLTFAIIKGATS